MQTELEWDGVENLNQALFLLVGDVLSVRRALIKAKVSNPLHVVTSGEEAIEYLSGRGKYANRAEYPLPSLVLLDLKMPGMDGVEVLRWIRQQPGFGSLRVVALTNSGLSHDVDRAYKVGANSFLLKPADFDRFVEISQALNGHWLWTNQAPTVVSPPLVVIVADSASTNLVGALAKPAA